MTRSSDWSRLLRLDMHDALGVVVGNAAGNVSEHDELGAVPKMPRLPFHAASRTPPQPIFWLKARRSRRCREDHEMAHHCELDQRGAFGATVESAQRRGGGGERHGGHRLMSAAGSSDVHHDQLSPAGVRDVE
jgi:hypothetical protein